MDLRVRDLFAVLRGLSFCAALWSAQAHAVRLYSNGGLNPQKMSKSGVAAPAGTSFSEIQFAAGSTTETNALSGIFVTFPTDLLADDFTVPAGADWIVESIDFYGYQSGAPATSSPFESYFVQILDLRPGDPGATVVGGGFTRNRLTSSTDALIYRIVNSTGPASAVPDFTRKVWRNRVTFSPPITLRSGTYWVEWTVATAGGGSSNHPTVTVPNARGLASFNARRFTSGARVDLLDIGNPSTAPDVLQDLPFDINGSTTAECGNGSITGAELCDDSNTTSGDGCDSNCTPTGCGNGVVTAGEVCDDGNTADGDGCSSLCKLDLNMGGGDGGAESGCTLSRGRTNPAMSIGWLFLAPLALLGWRRRQRRA